MMFHTPQKVVPRLILKMNNIELEPITDFNFLGIIVNKTLAGKATSIKYQLISQGQLALYVV